MADSNLVAPGATGQISDLETRYEREVLARLLDVIPVMAARFDPAVAAVVVNRHFTTTLGWTNEDSASLDLTTACYPDPELRAEALAFMHACNGAWREFPTRTKAGAIRHVLWTNFKLEHDLMVGVGFDVTDIRRTERDLETANARLREAALAGGLGIHEYFPLENRLVWDDVMRAWWGLDPEEDVTYEKFVARLHPEDRAAMQAAVDRSLDPVTGGRYDAEYRVIHPDGTMRWMHATGAINFKDGRAVRLTGTVHDITRDKELTKRLQDVDRRKDVFLATLSHELRNPLAPIRTAAHLLGLPGLGDAQLAHAKSIIQRQSQHMALLLDDLMDSSRIKQGKLSLRFQRVSLAAVVDAAVEVARPHIDRKKHRFTMTLPAEDVQLDADPLRLTQILSNLLSNAAKYTDAGGHIELDARVAGEELVVAVKDDGIGIQREALPHLFDAFSQVDGAHERAEAGLGIGLSLARGLVELHGGSIEARSDGPGLGSTFSVSLPIGRRPGD